MLRTLCHKAWVDTRIRFVFGLVLAVIPACGLVLWFKPGMLFIDCYTANIFHFAEGLAAAPEPNAR